MMGALKTYCYIGVFFIVAASAFFAGAALDSAAHLIETKAYRNGQSSIMLELPMQALQHIEVYDVSYTEGNI